MIRRIRVVLAAIGTFVKGCFKTPETPIGDAFKAIQNKLGEAQANHALRDRRQLSDPARGPPGRSDGRKRDGRSASKSADLSGVSRGMILGAHTEVRLGSSSGHGEKSTRRGVGAGASSFGAPMTKARPSPSPTSRPVNVKDGVTSTPGAKMLPPPSSANTAVRAPWRPQPPQGTSRTTRAFSFGDSDTRWGSHLIASRMPELWLAHVRRVKVPRMKCWEPLRCLRGVSTLRPGLFSRARAMDQGIFPRGLPWSLPPYQCPSVPPPL